MSTWPPLTHQDVQDAVTARAVIGDVGTAATPTGDALRAAYEARSLAGGRSGVKTYQPRLSLYNATDSSLRHWRAGLARQRAGLGAARIGCYGDSITEGYLSSPAMSSAAYPVRLQKLFDAKYGAAGEGFIHWWNQDDPRIVFGGTVTDVADFAPFGTPTKNYNNPAGTFADYIQFGPVTCDSFAVYLVGSPSSLALSYSIDGGTWGSVSTQKGSAGNVANRVVFSAGTLGSHTIKLSGTTGNVYVSGVEPIVGAAGVRVARMGKGGALASTLIDTNNNAPAGSLDFAFDIYAPDLSVLWLGHNEYLQNVPVATFTTNMQTLITRAKQAGDVLLLTTVPNSNQSLTPAQNLYDQALYGLADSNDCALLDLSVRWKDYATANGLGFMGDVTHPQNLGYSEIAGAIYDALVG